MSARTDKAWRWFKLVAIVTLVTMGIKVLFALGGSNPLNKVALALVGGVGGIFVFGGIAYCLGWLTGEDKSREALATPPLPERLQNRSADRPQNGQAYDDTQWNSVDGPTEASVVDDVYAKIDHELETNTLDRPTWTRAQGDAEGNAERAKALYIKYRAKRLLGASRGESAHQSSVDAITIVDPAKKSNTRVVAATAGILAVAIVVVFVIGFFTEKAVPTKRAVSGGNPFDQFDTKMPAQAAKTSDKPVDWSQFELVQPVGASDKYVKLQKYRETSALGYEMPSFFDVTGARRDGLSDTDIVTYLTEQTGFDLIGARKAGHSDSEIIAHITSGEQESYMAKMRKGGSDADLAARFGLTLREYKRRVARSKELCGPYLPCLADVFAGKR